MNATELPRLDQDINFTIDGVPCVMQLDTTAMNAIEGDLWLISPRNDRDQGPFFARDILSVFEQLELFSPMDYVCQPHSDHLSLEVVGEIGEFNLAAMIMESLPDWGGDSFHFVGGRRLARTLADIKEAIPEISFTRSDGSAIEYEEHVDRVAGAILAASHEPCSLIDLG